MTKLVVLLPNFMSLYYTIQSLYACHSCVMLASDMQAKNIIFPLNLCFNSGTGKVGI